VSEWLNVDAAVAIAPGSYQVVENDDVRIAVFNIDGAFYAIEDLCTHDYSTLTGGDLNGDEITCPLHGATFCLRTGEALTPPAYEDVPTFPVQITDEGVVQVRDNRFD
jgi:3-phenylpropionate/trans-cinnamate dioxygenase ferredoxin component